MAGLPEPAQVTERDRRCGGLIHGAGHEHPKGRRVPQPRPTRSRVARRPGTRRAPASSRDSSNRIIPQPYSIGQLGARSAATLRGNPNRWKRWLITSTVVGSSKTSPRNGARPNPSTSATVAYRSLNDCRQWPVHRLVAQTLAGSPLRRVQAHRRLRVTDRRSGGRQRPAASAATSQRPPADLQQRGSTTHPREYRGSRDPSLTRHLVEFRQPGSVACSPDPGQRVSSALGQTRIRECRRRSRAHRSQIEGCDLQVHEGSP